MDNFVTIFMNYKVSRLVEYGLLFCSEDTPFIRSVLRHYFRTYISNRYYGVFYTISDEVYNHSNLKREFNGLKEELLDDYSSYEGKISNELYLKNQNMIQKLLGLCYELVELDNLDIDSREDVQIKVEEFLNKHNKLNDLVGNKLNKLVSLVRETYKMNTKLLSFEDSYFKLNFINFCNYSDVSFIELNQDIRLLDYYKESMISKVYSDERLDLSKTLCTLQKVSSLLLQNIMNNKENKEVIVEIPDSLIYRGKINEDVMRMIDNPLIQKYVVLGIHYSAFQKTLFSIPYMFACIYDFSYTNNVSEKIHNIFQEGVFHYLVVEKCKYSDRDEFLDYDNKAMKILVFEEE